MADKETTIVLKVDLECDRCYKKIRRVLNKIQDKMNIKAISFDDKKNVVTISGPFDAEKVCRKLRCEAGQVIKGMDVMVEKEEEDEEVEEEELGTKVVVPAVDELDLRPLLRKMLEPKARPHHPCSKQTTPSPAQGVPMPSIWPGPARSVSGHNHEAPSYYGVPVYHIPGWYEGGRGLLP